MNNVRKTIAERKLYYSVKGESSLGLKEFAIAISSPFKVDKLEKDIEIKQGCYACEISFRGLSENGIIKYGIDAVQALNIATDLESLIKQLSKKYDIFWKENETYF